MSDEPKRPIDEDRAMAVLQRENDALATMLASLEERMPTNQELEFLRAAKLQSERASWFWQMVRLYFPWVVSIGGAIVSAAWWVASHVSIKGP